VFSRVGIIGVGLIGGSVARAARAANASVEVLGLDLGDRAEAAAAAGVIDRAGYVDAIAECDLVVLAAPISANLAWLDRLAAMRTPALVTDTGGNKRQMAAKAAALGDRLRFIGGHPMAGSERSGFAAADAELFRDRKWFLVPQRETPAADLDAVFGWIRALGAVPSVTDAETHDRVMAAVSALPQVTASALMAVVGERVDLSGLAMSGPGLRDTTRLAGSAATWMTDGLAHNSREVADAIDALITELRAVRDHLDTPERVSSLFTRAQQWRRALTEPR
jgi:prephenate dehydrogenase